MLCDLLSFLHNAITLLFGVYISAAFLGIQMKRRNIFILLGFYCAVGIIYFLSYKLFGTDVTLQIYPLIIHLPLILFLTLFYKYKLLPSLLSVLTAYLCCQLSKWIGLVAWDLSQLEWVYYAVRIFTTILVFVVLICFVSDAVAQLMQKTTKTLLVFALMPATYYLFDYATVVYTSLLYSGKAVVTEFLGFAICIVYLVFLLLYFRQYEEIVKAELLIRMMKMQRTHSQHEIEANKRSEYACSLLRHDMRHFLTNISAYIEHGETIKAQEYISEIISHIENNAIQSYSKNEIVNMILSSYEHEIEKKQIHFQHCIQIPEQLPISDVDLTCILSNALENAIQACFPLEQNKRHILLDLRMKEEKLLLSIKNTFAEKPEMVDDMPISTNAGHGFGTRSIRYVVEKQNGVCQFLVKDDWFIVRVIL